MIVVEFDDSVVEEKVAKLACKNEMAKSGFYDRTERAYDGAQAACDEKKASPRPSPKERVEFRSFLWNCLM